MLYVPGVIGKESENLKAPAPPPPPEEVPSPPAPPPPIIRYSAVKVPACTVKDPGPVKV
jgi:hypothetical protein